MQYTGLLEKEGLHGFIPPYWEGVRTKTQVAGLQ